MSTELEDLTEKVSGYRKAIGNIRKKLHIGGVPLDPSVMKMAEAAKLELLRLRSEKTALWDAYKHYVRDSLNNEQAMQARITELEAER